jgi:hypothetical protein
MIPQIGRVKPNQPLGFAFSPSSTRRRMASSKLRVEDPNLNLGINGGSNYRPRSCDEWRVTAIDDDTINPCGTRVFAINGG